MTLSQIINSISKKEWHFVAFLSLILILITTAPIIYGWLITPEGHVFTAQHFVSADDWFVYYSFINQGKTGKLLFNDLFSSIPHQPVFRPDWLLVGLIGWLFNLSAPVAFHLSRIFLIPIFFVVAYLFIAYFFSDQLKRKLVLIFLSFSSGLGAYLIFQLIKYPQNYVGYFRWPMDLWVPDINTFYTLFTSPHFIAATILLFLIFFLTNLFTETSNYTYAVVSGLSGLLLFWIHPFQILKVFAILGCFFLILMIREKKIIWPLVWYGLIFLLFSLPAIFYYAWLSIFDELTIQRALQNINPSVPLHLALISFGGLLLGAILAIYFLAKEKKLAENKYLFLVVWLVVQLVLLYVPISYQRRLGLGVHFPLVILTAWFGFYFFQLKPNLVKKRITLIIVLGLLVFLPSTLFVLASDIMVFSQGRELSYLDSDAYNAFLWLKENTPADSVIFSEVKTGNVLPPYALRTSYVGHAVETPDYITKKKEPAWFFSQNRLEEIEKNFLNQRNINYLYYGKLEKAIGDYSPEGKPYLKEVYSSPTVKVYQVLSR